MSPIRCRRTSGGTGEVGTGHDFDTRVNAAAVDLSCGDLWALLRSIRSLRPPTPTRGATSEPRRVEDSGVRFVRINRKTCETYFGVRADSRRESVWLAPGSWQSQGRAETVHAPARLISEGGVRWTAVVHEAPLFRPTVDGRPRTGEYSPAHAAIVTVETETLRPGMILRGLVLLEQGELRWRVLEDLARTAPSEFVRSVRENPNLRIPRPMALRLLASENTETRAGALEVMDRMDGGSPDSEAILTIPGAGEKSAR